MPGPHSQNPHDPAHAPPPEPDAQPALLRIEASPGGGDGATRLRLIGELDLSAVEPLTARLDQLKKAGARTVLDLSEVGFIDCAGLGCLRRHLGDARRDGWSLEVDGALSRQVQRLTDLVGVDLLVSHD